MAGWRRRQVGLKQQRQPLLVSLLVRKMQRTPGCRQALSSTPPQQQRTEQRRQLWNQPRAKQTTLLQLQQREVSLNPQPRLSWSRRQPHSQQHWSLQLVRPVRQGHQVTVRRSLRPPPQMQQQQRMQHRKQQGRRPLSAALNQAHKQLSGPSLLLPPSSSRAQSQPQLRPRQLTRWTACWPAPTSTSLARRTSGGAW